ncbi:MULTISPECIES: serine/threonine-protein kinase [Thermomonosporaceae]|uniref:serine/threonine-protein kinase n=1 Tax=Thermomonosporaceae TaxID=2012 RepID=UPI00255B1EEC|nr:MULTISPECIES: serine/threonine-protein kinase [Thermomonosporaceae]MDL4774535.1 serine/threonine-protein kinase [Actinomadura xylanilytica]
MDSLQPSDPRDIGGIELHGTLGEGGMGKVYFGVTPDGRHVAIKVIRKQLAGDPEIRERFDREVLAMGMVQGPRVASLVAAAGPGAERPWLAMEYVRGLTLKDYLATRKPLTAEMGAVLGDLLAEALGAIHRAGLLHRDLKPGNILLGPDGPKVIDFGLVDLTGTDQQLTKTGAFLGTLAFMAPEHVLSPKDLPPAADVYSLGATLVQALTGHLPYDRPHQAAMIMAIRDPDEVPDLSGVPFALEPVIGAMLAHDPALRPTPAEASGEFRQVLAGAGLGLRDARVHFTELTYVEQPSDPPSDIDPPRRRARQGQGERQAPRPAVSMLADRLAHAYAPGGRL